MACLWNVIVGTQITYLETEVGVREVGAQIQGSISIQQGAPPLSPGPLKAH